MQCHGPDADGKGAAACSSSRHPQAWAAAQSTGIAAFLVTKLANVRYLTQGDTSVVAPRYSPATQDITYMSQIEGQQPRVQVINLDTGEPIPDPPPSWQAGESFERPARSLAVLLRGHSRGR